MMNSGSPEPVPASEDSPEDMRPAAPTDGESVHVAPNTTLGLEGGRSLMDFTTPGLLIDELASSLDRSLDHSIDVPPLRRRVCLRGYQATRTGDRALRLIHALLVNNCLLPTALDQLSRAGFPRSLRKLFQRLRIDVEKDVFTSAMQKHERTFGTVAVQMVRMGEPLRGIPASIERYFVLRADIRRSGGLFARRMFCRQTRVFAAILGATFEISGDLPSAIRCAAVELPKRYHRGISECLRQVRQGESMHEALPMRGFFSRGFEPGFIELAGLAAEESCLAPIMQYCLEI
jgi:hypothetical protein